MFDVVGAQMQPTMTQDDRRFHDLARRFTEDRELMLVVEEQGRIVGGTLMFKTTLRAIGLEPAARGQGLGRRLLETLWETATRQGCGGISLGVGRGASAARDFYAHMGIRGSRGWASSSRCRRSSGTRRLTTGASAWRSYGTAARSVSVA